MRLFEEFWWVSALSRLDIRDAQVDVSSRGVHGPTRGVPPEEVTTFNLVRRIAGRRRASGGLAIALHSRSLEGGHAPSGRAPSGADLELAVEIAPGTWVDFALQAKKFNPRSGRYDGWNPAQNGNLANWASHNGRRAAGMLLYNTAESPFASPGNPSSLFNLCCSQTSCHGWAWPRWDWPDGRSPLAMSLIVDITSRQVARLTNPTPKDIADFALPWECLLCPRAQKHALRRAIGQRPEWVEPLEARLIDEEANVDVSADVASYSLVLGMSAEERESYSQSLFSD
jgi:hypothetical protein